MKQKTISVIVACFNEEENLIEMHERVRAVFKGMRSYSYELIYVDNSSIDKSEKILQKLAKKDKNVKVILMSRNFGSPQPSYIAALTHATGDAAVLLHGDIQDPPELIPRFVKKWEQGFDVVYGVRIARRGYGMIMNRLYKLFYYIFQKLSYVKAPLNAGDFSLIDRKIINELIKIDEHDYYLRFLRAFIGFNQIGIEYERDARQHGSSTENLITSLIWAKTFIVNYSFKPLEWISGIAFFVMMITVLLFLVNLIWILSAPGSPPGVPTIVLLILFLGAVQLLSLSVIAEYLAKIFLEVKKRPRFIIRKTINIKKKRYQPSE